MVANFVFCSGVPKDVQSNQILSYVKRIPQEVLPRVVICKTLTIPLHQHSEDMVEQYLNSEGAPREGPFKSPDKSRRVIISFPAGLPNIYPRGDRDDASQHGVLEGATSGLQPAV
jgi:hypothetical protein